MGSGFPSDSNVHLSWSHCSTTAVTQGGKKKKKEKKSFLLGPKFVISRAGIRKVLVTAKKCTQEDPTDDRYSHFKINTSL